MLRKLLKYDFKSVMKLWGLGALIVLALSVFGGLCLRVISSDRDFHEIIYITCGLGLFLTYLAICAFAILTFVLLAVRFYKNFFTDEGYLTFTLPVKLHTLMNSKLILALVTEFITFLVGMAAILIVLFVGLGGLDVVFENIGEFLKMLCKEGYMGWAILYFVEFLVVMSLGSAFSSLFMGCCITFGAVIAKRAKVLAAIGIYYAANSVFSTVTSIFLMFGFGAFTTWVDSAQLTGAQERTVFALTMFGIAALLGLLCSMLYTLQYRLLDRKLNLP